MGIAKITRPTLPKVYSRTRLFKILDNGRSRSITWISGPAGSGKTTLAASWLDSRKLSYLWYHVDPGDADLASFFYYLGLAAKKAAPRNKRPLPLLTPEYLMDVPTFSRRYFENLCARVKTPFFIVFDNYQEVPPESPFHAVLAGGIAAVPAGVRVMCLSRSEPLPAFSGLLAGSKMEVIGWEELRLRPDESRAIVGLHSKDRQNRKTLEWMHDRTQGWAAGLVLLARAANAHVIDPGRIEAVPPENIFDYFATELFADADEKTRDFLIKTSMLPTMNPAIAEQLTGNKDAGRILAELNRRNYFTYKSRQPDIAYQYHTLFRDFLRMQLTKTMNPENAFRLKKRAAKLMEETGQIEAAADLYRASSDWEGLMRIIFANAPAYLSNGRNSVIEQWIMAIPEAARTGNPWLLYWLGYSRMPMNIAESIKCFERSFELFNGTKDAAGAYLAWSAVVTAIMHEWSDYTRLDRWISWMENALQQKPSFASPDVEAAVIAGMAAALSRRRPDHPAFNEYFERALLLTRQGDPRLFVDVRFTAIWYHLYRGNAARVAELIEELRLCSKKTVVTPFSKLLINFLDANTTTYHHDRADKGLEILRESHSIAEETGVHVLDHYFGTQAAYLLFNQGRPDLAGDYLAKARASVSERQKDSYAHCVFLMGWRELLLGNTNEARSHAEKSLALSREAGVPFSEMFCRILLTHVMIRQKDHQGASREIREAAKSADRIGADFMKNRCLLAEAQIAFAEGKEQRGLDALRRAFTIGREKKIFNLLFHWQPGVMAELCVRALEQGIETEYVTEMIRKLRLDPPDANATANLQSSIYNLQLLESWPWPLKIFTLGRFRIEKDGKPLRGTVRFSRKVPQKPLELLKLLVALGGRDVKDDRIIDALWPDAEGDAGRKSLSVTLARLRDLLGLPEAVMVGDGAIRLNERMVWSDARAFEQMLRSSESGVRSSELETIKGQSTIEKALALYGGAFLEGEAGHWAIPRREKLRELFVRNVEKAGRLREEQKEWDAAAEIYRKGLEADGFVEQFYAGLMSCFRQQGRPSEALSAYEHCRLIFESHGIPLSPRIEAEHTLIRGQGKS